MRVGIIGINGKMGREVALLGLDEMNRKRCRLVGALVSKSNAVIGKDIGTLYGQKAINAKCTYNLNQLAKEADLFIDFSSPEHSLYVAEICSKAKRAHVCGTTGFSNVQIDKMKEFSKKTKIFWSSNMCTTIGILAYLIEQAALLLDGSFDVEIFDAHHKFKVDAPSGTALMLGKAVAYGKKVDFEKAKVLNRAGKPGPRAFDSIGFSSLRAGNIVGEHTVTFASESEKVELSHTAFNRRIFAEGAYKVAYWLKSQKAGKLYGMQDYLKSMIKK